MQIECIRKTLRKKFKNVDDYIEIAIGEAKTKISTDHTIFNGNPVRLLYRVAKNKLLDEAKRRKKFKHFENDANGITALELVVESPENSVLGDITEQEMLSAMSKKQQTVVQLRIDGFSAEEIATKECVSVFAINERFKALRKKMKKYL